MKNNSSVNKLMVILNSIAALICLAGIVVMFTMDRSQTYLARQIMFSVAVVLIEISSLINIKNLRKENKSIISSVIICVVIAIFLILLWMPFANTPIF